ncbi:D-Ala-D-Ala carboxypeptidase family metallohydrolase [Aureimonas leprariae]|uniref:D-Ala-D-Ala carboxypeptidase family metallohydrolase n=1 Tax=Plantimonas leprariae TaxID=2615207 RepID=UPI001387567C|nr:D-Ala-D-Ala carboxypeptidase family metallohydrolase [Aureimonas leprariae]
MPSIRRTPGWRVGRRGILAAMCLGPLVGGCVSAVDDTTAFGFGKSGPAAAAAEAAKQPNKGEAIAEAARSADGEKTAALAADAAEKSATPAEAAKPALLKETASAASANEAVARTASREGPIATGPAAIAAFAGSSVMASSQTDQPATGGNVHANQTMFASLYAQSRAKTPIRNADVGKTRRVILPREGAPVAADSAVLPGVRSASSLFEIGQKASADYDADILDEASGEEGVYQTASISGLARLAPNGLMVQRPDVQTSCFQPDLVAIIKAVEARFHTKIVVTSGYRSPSHNLRVNGAKKSMHLQCKAADILVPNADKFQVANYVRTLPGRGGVGTYCHTAAIHVDTGRQRDWNWACRRTPSANLLLASQKTVRSGADD